VTRLAIVTTLAYAYTCVAYLQPLPVSRSAVGAAATRHVARREAVQAAGLAALLAPFSAHASGGATSGKTTSIPRAKLRYYGRMTTAITEFQALAAVIGTAGQKQAGKVFFSDNDEAAYVELKSAGYLLAVAFKIDSKIPPDKLQTVKDFKKMIKDLDSLKGAMGGSADEANTSYAKAKASMDEYLVGVELPPLGDARYDPA